MKLLIVTQVVDTEDPVLGFFVRWIEEFSKRVEHIEVICLKEGKHALPENVRVHSLGKENGRPLFGSIAYAFRFLRLAWRLRSDYDVAFVHMNAEYVVLGGWLWRLMGKRIALWYTHKSVTPLLRAAVFCAHTVFTASPESFRLKTDKLRVVGHGIDIEQFPAVPHTARQAAAIRILTIGRLSPTKRVREMLAALDALHARGVVFSFTVVGAPAAHADERYEREVRAETSAKPYAAHVHFSGAVSHAEVPALLADADVFLNLSQTGSMDKAVLEALAAGVPAVTTNEAFRSLLAPAGLFVEHDTARAIADALAHAATADLAPVTAEVRSRYALPGTITRIIDLLSGHS